MASRSKVRASLRSLLEKKPIEPHISEVAKLQNYDDRALVLVGCSILEDALARAIKGYFIELDKTELSKIFEDSGCGPLASLSAKITLAFALGIYGNKTRDDLITIKSIRNVFAHAIDNVTFETEEIKYACNAINFMKPNNGDIPPRGLFLTTLGFFVNTICIATDIRTGRGFSRFFGGDLKPELP